MFLKFPILVLLISALFAVVSADEPSGSVLSVYLPDYRVKADSEPALYGTTHLVLFSAKPNDDGSVDFARVTPELLAFGKKAQANSRTKVTFCVGGWGRGKLFANAVSSEPNRARFVDDLVAFCKAHRLDGVDIDWEFPKGDQEHADFALFLEAGLPAEKLILGVGFYAKEKGGERKAVSWEKIAGETAAGLPESEYGYWPVGPEACDLRLRLVKERGLGGVMVWDYGHDSDDPEHSLLKHLSAGLAE